MLYIYIYLLFCLYLLALSQHTSLHSYWTSGRATLELLWLLQTSMLPQKHFRDKEDREVGFSLWLHYIAVLGLCLLSTLCVNISLWEIKSFSPMTLDYGCLTAKKGILFSFCFFQDWLRSLLVIICLSDLVNLRMVFLYVCTIRSNSNSGSLFHGMICIFYELKVIKTLMAGIICMNWKVCLVHWISGIWTKNITFII